MYTFIKTAHSYWAFIVLILLVLAIANAFIGIAKKKTFNSTDFRRSLFVLISSHIQFLIGLILSAPITFNQFIEVKWTELPWFAIWRMGYVVIGTTFLTYLFNIYALKKLSPTTVGSFIYLQPIITILFALITANDTLDTTKILSCILVFIGVYLVSFKK